MSQEVVAKGVRWTWVISGLAVLIAGGALLLRGIDGNVQYYMSVSEYLERQPKYEGKNVKVAGHAHSIEKGTDFYSFQVEDQGKSIHVTYKGLAPDTFKEGSEVVVSGKGALDNNFEAKELLAKCASKYETSGMPPLEKMRGKSVY